MAREMRKRSVKLKCSIMGCKNIYTNFYSMSGVMVNTPNICDDCIKAAYLTLQPEEEKKEEAKEPEALVEEIEEEVEETEEDGKVTKRRRKKE